MSETPTETLRRAAAKLRTLAQVTGQDGWTWFTGPILDPGPFDFRSRVNAKRRTERGGEEWTGIADTHEHLADCIATMHPGVALAVADWLDAEADAHESGMAASEGVCTVLAAVGAGEHAIQVAVSTLDQALAVARTVLGEDGAQ